MLKVAFSKCIYSKGQEHCAFTDMVFWEDRLLVAFRRSQNHLDFNGAITILESRDGQTWTTWMELSPFSGDHRDPKFLIHNNRLYLTFFVRYQQDTNRGGYIMQYDARNKLWCSPIKISDDACWRAKSFGGRVYIACYRQISGPETPYSKVMREVNLWRSDDVCHFENLGRIRMPGNETELVFESDGSLSAFIRVDYSDEFGIWHMKANANYQKWTQTKCNFLVQGPLVTSYRGNRYLIGRHVPYCYSAENHDEYETANRKTVTSIWRITESLGGLEWVLSLPSQGDCSYAGAAQLNGELYISYYSQHRIIEQTPDILTRKGPSEIFVAKLVCV